jgi:ABC-2 type transport system permease protein
MSTHSLSPPPSPALPRDVASRGWIRGLFGPLGSLFYLRYCMRRNAWRREKTLGRVITAMFWLGATIGVIGAFAIGILFSYFVHSQPQVDRALFFWNAAIVMFLMAWGIQISTDLFRNDVLTLDRIMHLPISPSYAFALNYLSSLVNFPVIYLAAFVSGSLVGASIVVGPIALLLGISLVAYLFMVTAVTSQFQGALAAWMSTPRRRQTVMIVLSVFFMFFFPAMSLLPQWLDRYEAPPFAASPSPTAPSEVPGSVEGPGPSASSSATVAPAATDPWPNRMRWIQVCVPPFWFAACARVLSESSYHVWWITPCMLCVGLVSSRRSYRTTLRYYQDGFDAAVGLHKQTKAGEPVASPERIRWIERSLPGVSPLVSSIVMQTWISMWRAPEFKLMLLAPLVQPLVLAFLVQYWKIGQGEISQTLILLGFGGLQLYTASGMLGNQFGLDRSGFRTWVLSPIPRETILHGRNIAFGVPVWSLAVLLTLAVGLWWGLAIDKLVFVALALTTFVPAYLLISDLMSILSPFGIPPGTLQPKEFSWKQVVLSLAISTLHPTLLCLAALPFGVESLVEFLFPHTASWPIAALVAVPWLGMAFLLYRVLLPSVGRCLENFELKILQTVTAPID